MTSLYALIGLIAGFLVWSFGWWRQKRQILGTVPLIAPVYIQFLGLLVTLVFAADLIAALTGLSWKSPFRPQ